MPTTFRPYQPDQSLLLPPDLRDWLPEGHLAHHVSDLVDGLDLTALYAPYAGDGRRKSPYEADEITPEVARALLALPRTVGVHPQTGKAILAGIARYGAPIRKPACVASSPFVVRRKGSTPIGARVHWHRLF